MYRDAATPTLPSVLEPSVKTIVWLLHRWNLATASSFEVAMDVLKGEQESGWTGWGWMVSVILGFTARFCSRWWSADL